MNRILDDIPVYESKKISDQVKTDPSILNLSIGEPFYDPPVSLHRNMNMSQGANPGDFAINSNKYSNPRGEFELRVEIAARYRRLYGAAVDPNTNILVTHGAAGAILTSILTLTSEGDEIIIPDPSYMLYEHIAKLLSRKPVKVRTRPENGFRLTCDDIRSAIKEKTTAIIINSPENPTGAVYDRALVRSIRNLAIENNLYFIHDEVYDCFVFSGEHENVLQLDPMIDENCVLINSFSKRFSMMGYRLGWLVGSRSVIDCAVKLHTLLTLTLRSPEQHLAAKVLNDPETFHYLQANLISIKENVSALAKAIDESWAFDLMNTEAQGAFFLFPSVLELFHSLPIEYRQPNKTVGECVARYLLLEHKLAVVPGYVYGKQGANHIRLVAAVDHSVALEAAHRIRAIKQPAKFPTAQSLI
jgi:aspartate/methionine/tyrosine aminotransferase